jgi:hypothetical protein
MIEKTGIGGGHDAAILPINKIQKDINDKKNKEGIITQKTKIFLHGITALVQRQ